MKKTFISFLSIIVFLGMVGMASAVQYSGFGIWTEYYAGIGPNGDKGEGVPGNRIEASGSDSFLGYWDLTGLWQKEIPTATPTVFGMEYVTEYTGNSPNGAMGYIILSDIDVHQYAFVDHLHAFVTTDKDTSNNYLSGSIIITGNLTYNMTPLINTPFYMVADLTGDTPTTDSTYPVPNIIGHQGEIFIIRSVPEPATMLLLGLGLMGIAGIRRKLKG